MPPIKQFGIFADPYYWRTALLVVKKGLVRQYRNSFLGMLWTLLHPLSMLLVFALIMPMLIRFPVEHYALYLLATMPLWGFFSTSLAGASLTLISQAEILKRCMVSSTVFPVADVMRHSYTYLIAFAGMYVFALAMGFPGSWTALLVPLYLLPVVLTIMAMAVGIAFLAPYLRDIGELLTVSMSVLSWFSAVQYPIEALPPHVQDLMEWNPFYIMLEPVVTLVYHRTIPDALMVGKLLGLMMLSIAVGYALYRKCRRNFVYYL